MGVAVVSLDDNQLINLIGAAKRKLIFVAPGISLPVAKAVAARWEELDSGAIQVLVDADPEICRLGYGTIDGLRFLQETAEKRRGKIYQRPGIRIGLLISDEITLVFAPTPLLIEGGSTQFPHPNAIQFDGSTTISIGRMGNPFETGAQDLIQGGDEVHRLTITAVERDLSANPPLKFDLAQQVRVFNAQLEFVEFKLKGLEIGRKTVAISPDLMGLADSKAQRLLRSTFKLVGEDSKLSGDKVTRLKNWIVKEYLKVLPSYGTVVLRSRKDKLQTATRALERYVKRFQKQVRKRLEKEMEANREALLKALVPAVHARPPLRWKRILGAKPSIEAVRNQLDAELKEAFGSVADFLEEMNVKLVFKGVTYELLNDPKFIEMARKKIPNLKLLHEEFPAAKAMATQAAVRG